MKKNQDPGFFWIEEDGLTKLTKEEFQARIKWERELSRRWKDVDTGDYDDTPR